MKNVISTIKNSHFAIFIIIVLVAAIGVVVWFISIVEDGMKTSNTRPQSSLNQPVKSSYSFDSATAEQIRGLQPAADVSSAPPLNIEGRTSPFSE